MEQQQTPKRRGRPPKNPIANATRLKKPAAQSLGPERRQTRLSKTGGGLFSVPAGGHVNLLQNPSDYQITLVDVKSSYNQDTGMFTISGLRRGMLDIIPWSSASTAADSPKMPRVDSPKMPRVDSPKMPRVDSPKMPRVDSPKTPRVDSPNTPQVDSPNTLRVDSPKMPRVDSLRMPRIEIDLTLSDSDDAMVLAKPPPPAKRKITDEDIPEAAVSEKRQKTSAEPSIEVGTTTATSTEEPVSPIALTGLMEVSQASQGSPLAEGRFPEDLAPGSLVGRRELTSGIHNMHDHIRSNGKIGR